MKETKIFITKKDMLIFIPHVGDNVSFITTKNDVIVTGRGFIEKIISEDERTKLYLIKNENNEEFEVEYPNNYKNNNAIRLLDNKRINDLDSLKLSLNMTKEKIYHICEDNFYIQEAKKNIPSAGTPIYYTTLKDNGFGEVVSVRIKDNRNQEAIFWIKKDNGELIQVYNNCKRVPEDSVKKNI